MEWIKIVYPHRDKNLQCFADPFAANDIRQLWNLNPFLMHKGIKLCNFPGCFCASFQSHQRSTVRYSPAAVTATREGSGTSPETRVGGLLRSVWVTGFSFLTDTKTCSSDLLILDVIHFFYIHTAGLKKHSINFSFHLCEAVIFVYNAICKGFGLQWSAAMKFGTVLATSANVGAAIHWLNSSDCSNNDWTFVSNLEIQNWICCYTEQLQQWVWFKYRKQLMNTMFYQ